MAWHYIEYDDSKIYQDAENEARTNRIGLWKDPNPMEPWSYRRKK